eukprot:974352_1
MMMRRGEKEKVETIIVLGALDDVKHQLQLDRLQRPAFMPFDDYTAQEEPTFLGDPLDDTYFLPEDTDAIQSEATDSSEAMDSAQSEATEMTTESEATSASQSGPT